MKNISHIKKLSLIILTVLLSPIFVFAQTLNIFEPILETNQSGSQVEIGGQVSVTPPITLNDVMIRGQVFNAAPPANYSGPFNAGLNINPGEFTSSGSFFTFINGGSFTPGQTYHFFFSLMPAGGSVLTNFTPVNSVTTLTIPNPNGGGNGNSGGTGNGGGGGNNSGTGGGGTATTTDDNTANTLGWPSQVIENPLQVSDLNNFVVGLLNALIKIGIPIMVVFLVYSGLRLVMARGNEKELADAKKNLLWVIIGAAILLGGWTIVKVLKGTFNEIDLVYITSLIKHIV